MRYPLNDPIVVTGEYKEVAQPGTGLPDSSGVRRHIGVDLRTESSPGVRGPEPVYAPGAGVVTASFTGTAGQTLEMRIAGKLWRFMHLSQRLYSVGASVGEGQRIAMSGNSGGVAYHLHVDVRRDGTTWNASLSNYYDFRSVIAEANRAAVALPPVGSTIQLIPVTTRTTYRAGTATVAGSIRVTDNTFKYVIRGHDAKYPGRVLINSASGGGNNVGIALYFLNGTRISNWVQL